MSDLGVLVLGVGDAFSALYYSTCFAVRSGDAWLLVDCPHPIRKILRESSAAAGLSLDVGDFAGVLLTHLHADHCSGLEGFVYFYRYGLGGRKPRLYAHPAVSERLWAEHLAPGAAEPQRTPRDLLDLHPLSESAPVKIGPFQVECRRNGHSVPTTAFRIRAGGRCLGYSADTPYDPELLRWLGAADVIIHEAGEGAVHTPYEQLAALPEELRRKLRLVHYSDRFDVTNSVVEPLRQGQWFEV